VNAVDEVLALKDFQAQPGLHCESGTLRMMLAHAGIAQSEAMVFGLGQGIDFVIWPAPDASNDMPVLSGRGDSGDLIRHYGNSTGVEFCMQEAETPEQALLQARSILARGQVAGLKLDIFYLPYFSAKRHFCAHFVALYAIDGHHAWVVDTAQQGGCQRIALADLSRARASRAGLQSSDSLSVCVASTAHRRGMRSSLTRAIAGCARNYLAPADDARGYLGLQTVVRQMPHWWSRFRDPAATIMRVADFWEFAGTGGANFRALHNRFLHETCDFLGLAELAPLLREADEVEQGWAACIRGLRASAESRSEATLRTVADKFAVTAEREHALMAGLQRLFKDGNP
jgi:hypothetical protein